MFKRPLVAVIALLRQRLDPSGVESRGRHQGSAAHSRPCIPSRGPDRDDRPQPAARVSSRAAGLVASILVRRVRADPHGTSADRQPGGSGGIETSRPPAAAGARVLRSADPHLFRDPPAAGRASCGGQRASARGRHRGSRADARAPGPAFRHRQDGLRAAQRLGCQPRSSCPHRRRRHPGDDGQAGRCRPACRSTTSSRTT